MLVMVVIGAALRRERLGVARLEQRLELAQFLGGGTAAAALLLEAARIVVTQCHFCKASDVAVFPSPKARTQLYEEHTRRVMPAGSPPARPRAARTTTSPRNRTRAAS